MSWVQCRAAHCDVCGHEWLASGQPKQCAKCKTRAWNSAGQVIACAIAVNEAIYDAIERLPARPKPRTKGPTAEQFAAMKPSERHRSAIVLCAKADATPALPTTYTHRSRTSLLLTHDKRAPSEKASESSQDPLLRPPEITPAVRACGCITP